MMGIEERRHKEAMWKDVMMGLTDVEEYEDEFESGDDDERYQAWIDDNME